MTTCTNSELEENEGISLSGFDPILREEIQITELFKTEEEAERFRKENFPHLEEWSYGIVSHHDCTTFNELKIKWKELVESFTEEQKKGMH